MPARGTWSATGRTTDANTACSVKSTATSRTISSISLRSSMADPMIWGNLALACHRCNLCKGPNLTGFDRQSGRIVPLFPPRRDRWTEPFAWRGPRIEGLTAIGRATVLVLGMNDARRLDLRAELLARRELA